MYAIFGSETPGLVYCHVSCLIGLMFDAIQSGGPGGEAPGKAWGFARPRGPPMRGMVRQGDGTISRDGQGLVDALASEMTFVVATR